MVFVPAWGWVGSNWILQYWLQALIFVPEWGWVGSQLRKMLESAY